MSSPHYPVPSPPHMYNAPAKRKPSKADLVVVVTILLTGGIFATCLVFSLLGESGDLDARIMSVFRVDGDTVSIQNVDGAWTRLLSGGFGRPAAIRTVPPMSTAMGS